MFNMKQVGKKILTMRKAHNMTQTELADKMDVSFQAVSNWERGNSMPDISKLPQLAALFNCTVDELLDEKSDLLHSAMTDDLQEYAEKNPISSEELKAAVPILKPNQIEQLASNMLLKNGDAIEVFYPYLDEETLREVAEQRIKRGDSVEDMLEYLDEDDINELALMQYDQGQPVDYFYEYMDEEYLKELAGRMIKKGDSIENHILVENMDEDDIGELALMQYDQGRPVDCFYEYMEEDLLAELARRKIQKKESITDLLDYLDSDILKDLMRELMS